MSSISSIKPEPKIVLISGGSGLIGTALTKSLERNGHTVRRLSTNRTLAAASEKVFYWDISKRMIDDLAFSGVNVVYNLAGEPVAGARWSKEQKQKILDSRVFGTQLLAKKIADTGLKLDMYFGASAVGYYGDVSGGHACVESDTAGQNFLARVCEAWEEAHNEFRTLSDRIVIGRFANVLSANGGFIEPFEKTAKFGLGPLMGQGKLKTPWIHLSDLTAFLHHCISGEESGVFNLAADSEHWRVLQKQIYKAFGAYFYFKVPSFMLQIMLGEMASIILQGAAVDISRLRQEGFEFKYPDLDAALSEIKSARQK